MPMDISADAISGLKVATEHKAAVGFGETSGILEPLLQGARARGFADAMELMGQGAILLDANGAILHVTSRAAALFGTRLAIKGPHLVGSTSDANQRIGRIISAALKNSESNAVMVEETVIFGPEGADSGLQLKAANLGEGFDSPFQLLKGVILVDIVPVLPRNVMST